MRHDLAKDCRDPTVSPGSWKRKDLAGMPDDLRSNAGETSRLELIQRFRSDQIRSDQLLEIRWTVLHYSRHVSPVTVDFIAVVLPHRFTLQYTSLAWHLDGALQCLKCTESLPESAACLSCSKIQ